MSEVTASSRVAASFVSTPSDAGIAAAAKLVVDGVAVVCEQRVLANRATCSAALWRRRVAELRAMYVGKD